MQKGSALPILLLLVVILGSLVGYYFYSTFQSAPLDSPKLNTPKQDNKNPLFNNTELGFEFEYVEGQITLNDTEEEFNQRGNGQFRKNFKSYIGYEPAKFLGAVVLLDKSKDYEKSPLTIWVFENPENLSIEKWYENFWYYPFVWGDFTARRNNVAPIKEATVAGQLAKSGIVTYQPGKPKFIYIPFNNKMYLFRVTGEGGNKILESFKFI